MSEEKRKSATSRRRTRSRRKKKGNGSVISKKASEGRNTTAEEGALNFGTAPTPMVLSRHGDLMHERRGRGYSLTELRSVGIDPGWARRVGLPLDLRRRSGLEQNVESLRAWYRKGPTRKDTGAERTEEQDRPQKRASKEKKKKQSKTAGRKESKKDSARKTRKSKEKDDDDEK